MVSPSLPNNIPPPRDDASPPPNPPGTTVTKPPNDRNNDELDSPPSVGTPPSRDPPAKGAPAVRATVEPAERRRAAAWSKREVAKPSAGAEEAAGAGVFRKSM